MNEQEYIEQIIAETGYQPTKEQLDYLNAMSKLSRQEILLELRNGMTSYGSMQPLPELLKSYGANEQFIKTAQKEIAQWYWSNLGKIAEEGNKLTDFEMEHVFKFSLDKLKELGLSDAEVNNAFMTDDFFKTGLAFTDPGMRTEFDKFLRENAGMSIFEAEDILNEVPDTIPDNMIIENITDTPTNVVDDVTPTQALDELDDAISKADGVDNLNKAKKIINNNPGVFRKIFSVLEKADIGDQVITKAIIPKVLPRIGLAAATGPVGMAYAAYEIALLLSDVGQAAYKAQTTDESFWDNFGEISDKYSIAYKISKPVYDIILDNLNNDLTEEEDEEILFSFNR